MKIVFKLILLPLLLITPIHASDFYAILIGNLSDRMIANMVTHDIKKMEEEVRLITQHTGQELRLIVIQKKHFNHDELLQIDALVQPNPDDTILFYQSSHGFRSPEKIKAWPILDFTPFHIDLEVIVDTLSAKHPRLLICIADVCNAVQCLGKRQAMLLDSPPALAENLLRSKETKKNKRDAHLYKQLFTLASGTIIASAATPGNLSFTVRDEGGLFTMSFIQTIEKAARGFIPAEWDHVLNDVVKDTTIRAKNKGLPNQTPQFKVF